MFDYLNLFNLSGHYRLRSVLVLEILLVSGILMWLQIYRWGFDFYDVLTILFGLATEYLLMTVIYFGFNLLYLWWLNRR